MFIKHNPLSHKADSRQYFLWSMNSSFHTLCPNYIHSFWWRLTPYLLFVKVILLLLHDTFARLLRDICIFCYQIFAFFLPDNCIHLLWYSFLLIYSILAPLLLDFYHAHIFTRLLHIHFPWWMTYKDKHISICMMIH